jgi:hypothetical protein
MARIIFLLIVTFSISVAQKSKNIEIGDITLTLGMSKTKVLERLHSDSLITKSISDDSYLIETSASDPIPSKIIGDLTFKGEKLYSASRSWFMSSEKETVKSIRTLISLVVSSMNSNMVPAKVTKAEQDMPDRKMKQFTLTLGGKSFIISILDLTDLESQSIFIKEVIQ